MFFTAMPSDKIATAKPSLVIRSAIFFILFALILYLWVEPKLIYHDIDQLRAGRIYIPEDGRAS